MRCLRRSPLAHILLGFVLGAVTILQLLSTPSDPSSRPPASPLSSTLGFSRILVLSLPSRTDRRVEMRKLGSALGLDFEMADATNGREEKWVSWMEERAGEVRRRKMELMAEAQGIPPAQVRNIALARSLVPSSAVPFPDLPASANFLSQYLHHSASSSLSRLPSLPSANFPPTSDSAAEIEAVLSSSLPSRPERLATLATWHSHVTLWRRMIDEGWGESILILEDDVDVEWEVGRIWAQIEKRLPREAWDIVYLGDCGGREGENPAYLHPYLHRSTSPICLHAYAISLRGASRLLDLLHSSPWTAFSSPIDLQLAYLIRNLPTSELSAFSLEPPLFTQRSDEEEEGWRSDIRSKREEARKWTGVLGDSTVQRTARREGRYVRRKEWEEEEFYRFFYGEKGDEEEAA
ncbi:hypothetical protein JCM6882_001926 [Rhodosporidiobolus microsporus]